MLLFKSNIDKLCDKVSVVLSGNNIYFVHETTIFRRDNTFEYMKTFSNVTHQTCKFYAQANTSS